MSWFYLALLAPLLYAVVNLLDDNLLQFVYKSPYIATFSAGIYGALPLLSLFFLDFRTIPTNLAIISVMAGFLTICYLFFYFKGLESDQPSIVSALFGMAPATIPFFAYFIVHERLSALQVVGFIIVLLASLGLAVTDFKKLKFSKAFLYITIAVVFMDAISIMTKYVYQKVDFYPAYMYFSVGMALGGIAFLLLKLSDNKKQIKIIAKSIKKLLPIFIVAELTALVAEFTLNLAISRGPVSLVKVIEGIQPMFVLIIALVLYPFAPRFFREAEEDGAKRKFIYMGIIVAGLAVISIGSTT